MVWYCYNPIGLHYLGAAVQVMVLLNGAVQIKPYQTSPSSRINKYMWKWDEPPTQIWFINRRDNRIVILWRDGFVHLVEVQLVASGRKLPVPVFQASIWLLRCFLLFWTALSTKTPGKSWSEKVKRMGQKQGRCLWMDITIIKSRWYKAWFSVLLPYPWYGNSPCQWQPLDNNNFARPLRSIRAVQKARNSKAT